MNRHTDIKREPDPPAELESQFILRLPPVCTIINKKRVCNLISVLMTTLVFRKEKFIQLQCPYIAYCPLKYPVTYTFMTRLSMHCVKFLQPTN